MLDEPDYRTTSLLVVNRLKELKVSGKKISPKTFLKLLLCINHFCSFQNSQQMFTLLAEGNPSVEEIEKLIQDGANVNATDEKGLTPLLRLTKSKKISGWSMSEIADLLIQHGANVHLRDRKGRNALVLSCENCEQHGDMGIIYLLIKNGIDIHCRNEDGDNALMLLCRYYSHNDLSSLVDFFIHNGIDFNCKNRYGDNALTLLCRYYNHENLLRVIRRASWKTVININCKNKYGDNALTLLCQYYNQENLIDVITFLIERLFKVTKETRDYFHMFYSKNNRDEVLQLLHV
jgi:serine/threonine-protein kinase/endoribonuclease IRE1